MGWGMGKLLHLGVRLSIGRGAETWRTAIDSGRCQPGRGHRGMGSCWVRKPRGRVLKEQHGEAGGEGEPLGDLPAVAWVSVHVCV